jgi:hypothetical protein
MHKFTDKNSDGFQATKHGRPVGPWREEGQPGGSLQVYRLPEVRG